MKDEFTFPVENSRWDPFWENFSKVPFFEILLDCDEDDEDGVFVSREGFLIRICACTKVVYLDLSDSVLVSGALAKGVKSLREVSAELMRYTEDRTEHKITEKIEALPQAIQKVQKDAQTIATLLDGCHGDPEDHLKEVFWTQNVGGMLDRLRESVKDVEDTLRLAQDRRRKAKKEAAK